MKNIVITGSTRGIGLGLAEQFLAAGQAVVISGRYQEKVDLAVGQLSEAYPTGKIYGLACDMTDYPQVINLWDKSLDHFQTLDIWINNAGIAQSQTDFWDLEAEQIQNLVDTNITGAMFGAKVALAGFLAQGRGAFYNMEGLGSDGRQVQGLTLYGTSKRALNYLTDSLVSEVEGD